MSIISHFLLLVKLFDCRVNKLYLNDVGILTGILYGNNVRAVLDDERSINLGAVYESVAASELIAHGYKLFYYDNRNKGEVDYLIDDYDSLSTVPIEIKSGKDYTVHSALNNFVSNEDYHIKKAFVLSKERTERCCFKSQHAHSTLISVKCAC